jgi:hypothetical protein
LPGQEWRRAAVPRVYGLVLFLPDRHHLEKQFYLKIVLNRFKDSVQLLSSQHAATQRASVALMEVFR